MKWSLDINYHDGVFRITQGDQLIAWAHTEGDTPTNLQLVDAFTKLCESHNSYINHIKETLLKMTPADRNSMLRGLEELGYLTTAERLIEIEKET